jgi:hypothetical protein
MRLIVKTITNLKNSSGLCSFRVNAEDIQNLNASLSVEISGFGYRPQIFGFVGDTVIGLHTHLLNPGNHEVKFKLINNSEVIAETSEIISLDTRAGLYDVTRNAILKSGAKLFFQGGCDSSMYPYESNHVMQPWFDREDGHQYLSKLLSEKKITEKESDYLTNFYENGFLEIQDLIDDGLIDLVNREIDNAVSTGYQGYEKLSSQRLEGLHECYPNIRRLWLDERHRRIVNLIFGVNARPSQSLTFVCGSQQSAHSDLVYLTTFPAGYMCGMWIALQTVEEGSGELVVYPGSHRDRRIYFKDTGVERMKGGSDEFDKIIYSKWAQIASKYKPLVYRPKKGSILIWHENLLHGGSIRANHNLERRSMVIHYFADGACVYYDHSGSVGHVAPLEMVKSNMVL